MPLFDLNVEIIISITSGYIITNAKKLKETIGELREENTVINLQMVKETGRWGRTLNRKLKALYKEEPL